MLHLCLTFITICALCFTSVKTFATPAQVMIIRHGEKPPTGEILNLRGEIRAAALAPYFAGTPALLLFGTPVAVYGERPDTKTPTLRPIETILPTVKTLKIPLHTKFTRNQISELVHEILTSPLYEGKNVLICWEHFMIPNIAHTFGVSPIPPAWPGDVYDRTFVIRFNKDGSVKSFHNLPQKLLFGDSTT